jgi:hypothetical protein
MNIPVSVLIEALKNLPPLSKWEKEDFIFRHECYMRSESIQLRFIKNIEKYRWELVV